MAPFESTARPFGYPVVAMVRLLRSSGLISVTHPRLPPSTTSQVPSGRATGPSGSTNPLAKTRLMLVEISGSGKTPSIDSTDSLEEWDQIVTAVALESRQNLPLEALLGQMSRP